MLTAVLIQRSDLRSIVGDEIIKIRRQMGERKRHDALQGGSRSNSVQLSMNYVIRCTHLPMANVKTKGGKKKRAKADRLTQASRVYLSIDLPRYNLVSSRVTLLSARV